MLIIIYLIQINQMLLQFNCNVKGECYDFSFLQTYLNKTKIKLFCLNVKVLIIYLVITIQIQKQFNLLRYR